MATLIVQRGGEETRLSFAPPCALDELLARHGFAALHPCGGRGVCGKCAAVISGCAVSSDGGAARLICQTTLLGDASVALPEDGQAAQIELGGRTALLGSPMAGAYGAAIDIGTTTLCLKLYDLKTGACVSEAARLNPQTTVAADVMGRIGAALRGELSALREQVASAISALLSEACVKASVDEKRVASQVVAGNTTMLYLLTGRDPACLSRAPFIADHLFDETITLSGRETYLPPCISAFVGADITCAILDSGLCDHHDSALLCDVGTNGELALIKNGRLYTASTAAGPAFEGAGISCGVGSVAGAVDRVWVEQGRVAAHTILNAPPVGVCGSGLIDAIAAYRQLGEIDETGATECDTLPLLGCVKLLPADVRAVQLAKAAIAAGIETLLETASVSEGELGALIVAGGFGSHLDKRSAAAIGLIPFALIDRMTAIGNASLSGAAKLLLDTNLRAEARRIAGVSESVALGGNPRFNEHYIDQMMFPGGE